MTLSVKNSPAEVRPTPLITPTPTALVIFGATGDLSRRKLLPALFDLYRQGHFPTTWRIIGFSRDQYTTASFRQFVEKIITARPEKHTASQRADFLQKITYQPGQFEQGQSYLALSEELIRLETQEFGSCSNKLFYLAVPPTYYEVIFQNLAHSGLSIPCAGADGWTRVLVEKPFGKDLATAQKLDQILGLLFKEEQIFRVDHYLAKEALQNILAFRFANSIFELLWNNTNIAKVEIKFWEELGVGERGAFYEDIGALRDVGQNHMLQMLALIAMEDPGKLSAAAIRRKRTNVLKQLRPLTPADIRHHTVRGQYEGYRAETAVRAASDTETYFRFRAFVDNDRWQGVPFYLESGKKMQENKTEIAIYFRESNTCLTQVAEERHQNLLIFRIQPNEGISLVFWAKKPGFAMDLESKLLSFSYHDEYSLLLPDAYERVLFDCFRGDQTLFTSTQEVKAAWKFITPILEQWHSSPLLTYQSSSRGPKNK
ncbi:MAG: glucose-6-phosphate dehydrogenase [Candidatus Andersenbacteria bacterium]